MPNRLIKSVVADKDTFMLARKKLETEAKEFDEAAEKNRETEEVSKSMEDAWRENARKLRDLASQL